MTTMAPPTRRGAATPAPANEAPASASAASIFGTINRNVGQRVVLFGPGGIGKTSAAMRCPGPIAFIDFDESLPKLPEVDGVLPVPCDSWATFRKILNSPELDTVKTIVIDTATKAEEIAGQFVCANIRGDKGQSYARVAEFPYGKGFEYVYEEFLKMLADLDKHMRAGRNVVLICHDCVSKVINPRGEDFDRYEPRLQNPPSGKASIRLRVKEWADHVIFLGHEITVDEKTGKVARGSGSKVLYFSESPYQLAKSRGLAGDRAFDLDSCWKGIFSK
jgi:hypothetical protein